MKKPLSTLEAILYGMFLIIFVTAIVYLVTLDEEVTEVEYLHQYNTDVDDPSEVRIGVLANQGVETAHERWDETANYLEKESFNTDS